MKKSIIILIILCLVIITLIPFIHPFLACTHRTNRGLLVIEGWLPDYALEYAVKEFDTKSYTSVVTTGVQLPDLYEMSHNGHLIFLLDSTANRNSTLQSVTVNALGSKAANMYAHFTLSVNDSVVGSACTTSAEERYIFTLKSPVSARSIRIHFNNDAVIKDEDRNLFVRSISINGREIKVRSHDVYFDADKFDGKNIQETYFKSFAEECANKLINRGIHKDQIVAIPALNVSRHKTLSSAIAFKEWLTRSGIETQSICVLSLGVHARRSYASYKKVLGPDVEVGIIAIPDRRYNPERWWASKAGRTTVSRELFRTFIFHFLYLSLQS